MEHVSITGVNLSIAVAVSKTTAVTTGCLWELRPFYYHLFQRPLHKWLCGHGRGQGMESKGGAQQVETLAEYICPSLRPCLVLGARQREARQIKRSSAIPCIDRWIGIKEVYQETMVSVGWLLPFLLSMQCMRVKRSVRTSATNLLQTLCETSYRISGSQANIRIQNGTVRHTADSLCKHIFSVDSPK